jgi:hypothetical protein
VVIVTAARIIEEIQRLPEAEQARVIEYIRKMDQTRLLSGRDLENLAKKMVESQDPDEVASLKKQITRGFYGGEPHA